MKRRRNCAAKNVTATQELDTAKANAMRTEAAVAAAQVNLDYCSIRSPIDGRVGLRQVDVGNTVAPASNSAVLVTIDNLDPIYTDFTIAEPDLPLVRQYLGGPNLKVVTDAEGDNIPPREGQALFHRQHRCSRAPARCRPAPSRPIPIALFGRRSLSSVRLILDMLKDARLVPSGAVQIGQKGPYIFVVKSDSTLELRQVKPGQTQGDLT